MAGFSLKGALFRTALTVSLENRDQTGLHWSLETCCQKYSNERMGSNALSKVCFLSKTRPVMLFLKDEWVSERTNQPWWSDIFIWKMPVYGLHCSYQHAEVRTSVVLHEPQHTYLLTLVFPEISLGKVRNPGHYLIPDRARFTITQWVCSQAVPIKGERYLSSRTGWYEQE